MLSTKGSAALQVNQIRAGAALSYVSMALSTVISLVYTPIMLRQLGDSEFGVYQAVLPIISREVAMLGSVGSTPTTAGS